MPADDLKQYATSSHDFYALLGITFETSESDIRRAYRKTALKYHPDKVGNDPSAVEKFHLLQIAYDVLSDPAVKALYDNARTARSQKQRQNELFEGKRRQMKEDLEARERGVKRGREEEEGAEEKLEREIRRLAEDGKRRRREREEMLRRDLREEQQKVAKEGDTVGTSHQVHGSNGAARAQTGVAEIDRTVKVRWPREGAGDHLDKDRLTSLFSKFGKVESAFLLKDKKQKTADKREKKIMATGVIVYASLIGAYAAVEDTRKQAGEEWNIFDSVFWAGNKEPDFAQRNSSPPEHHLADSPPSTPLSTTKSTTDFSIRTPNNAPSSPLTPSTTNGDGLRKVPSFASFSSAAFSTPKGSPFGKGLGAKSPSLEEITMIRLRNAEKKRLEDEIRRGDEAAAAAEAK
ncbi:MAG: hypothetical protein M1830_001931 [Pleopsidium flavum]|nr:MAG: hypothetical protein M1830_001931 [Pleopsidium flavum]